MLKANLREWVGSWLLKEILSLEKLYFAIIPLLSDLTVQAFRCAQFAGSKKIFAKLGLKLFHTLELYLVTRCVATVVGHSALTNVPTQRATGENVSSLGTGSRVSESRASTCPTVCMMPFSPCECYCSR